MSIPGQVLSLARPPNAFCITTSKFHVGFSLRQSPDTGSQDCFTDLDSCLTCRTSVSVAPVCFSRRHGGPSKHTASSTLIALQNITMSHIAPITSIYQHDSRQAVSQYTLYLILTAWSDQRLLAARHENQRSATWQPSIGPEVALQHTSSHAPRTIVRQAHSPVQASSSARK